MDESDIIIIKSLMKKALKSADYRNADRLRSVCKSIEKSLHDKWTENLLTTLHRDK